MSRSPRRTTQTKGRSADRRASRTVKGRRRGFDPLRLVVDDLEGWDGPGRPVLVTSDQAVPTAHQHTKPCSDCPWRRDAVPGWLGGSTTGDWLAAVHGEGRVDCHVLAGPQCAGAAIYRRNVAKRPRDPQVLVLDVDRDRVFSSPVEFQSHHRKGPNGQDT